MTQQQYLEFFQLKYPFCKTSVYNRRNKLGKICGYLIVFQFETGEKVEFKNVREAIAYIHGYSVGQFHLASRF